MINLFKEISPGKNPPHQINIIIDIPKGEKNKYEYREEEGYFELDRVLYSPFFFPFEYGFIPQSASEDGDSLDVVLLTAYSTFPGCLIKARPIGVLLMEDEKGIDNKIIAVPLEEIDPRFKEIRSTEDLGEHLKKEIEVFFADYKKLEKGKYVKIKGWVGTEKAKNLIEKGIRAYQESAKNKKSK